MTWQSRLVVDVRDAADAHIAAATLGGGNMGGKRLITSCERRVPAAELADGPAFKRRTQGPPEPATAPEGAASWADYDVALYDAIARGASGSGMRLPNL